MHHPRLPATDQCNRHIDLSLRKSRRCDLGLQESDILSLHRAGTVCFSDDIAGTVVDEVRRAV